MAMKKTAGEPCELARFVGSAGNDPVVFLVESAGVMNWARVMSDDPRPSGWTSFYRAQGDRAVRSMFGQTLRQLYEVPRQTPHRLLVILMQLDASEGDDPPPEGESER
jgi:hypothetical protein